MSLFLVGGGYDDSLVEVYDEFVSQARHHNADAPIALVVAGPPSESADHAAEPVSYTHLTLPTIYSV